MGQFTICAVSTKPWLLHSAPPTRGMRTPDQHGSLSAGIGTSGGGDGSSDGLGVGNGDGTTVGLAVGGGDGPGVGFAVGRGEGSCVGCGVGRGDGPGVGFTVGRGVGPGVGLGVGRGVGPNVGLGVGRREGSCVGRSVGRGVGGVGCKVGCGVGRDVGSGVGCGVGLNVGFGVTARSSPCTLARQATRARTAFLPRARALMAVCRALGDFVAGEIGEHGAITRRSWRFAVCGRSFSRRAAMPGNVEDPNAKVFVGGLAQSNDAALGAHDEDGTSPPHQSSPPRHLEPLLSLTVAELLTPSSTSSRRLYLSSDHVSLRRLIVPWPSSPNRPSISSYIVWPSCRPRRPHVVPWTPDTST